MRIKTRELELSKALDEVFLRLSLIDLRIFQLVISIPIIGFVAAIISGLSNADVDVPSKASAAIAIACVSTVYAGVTVLPVFFEGPLYFTMMALLDAGFVGAWSSLIGVWDNDGTGTCTAFESRYFGDQPRRAYFKTDCKLVKAMFAFMIINLCVRSHPIRLALNLRVPEELHLPRPPWYRSVCASLSLTVP
ncbi:hypothetical protein A1O1_05209 [Capronia coronata CBS 617.96]|uniref:Uncharacterized protein n=1 Tax=Capronia coronata CBS 617.96 TaxID=1182541 RepID=W9Z175_9EURO|nr:uncharacterized protein A1O1_05209 [Capronia coronata CBS 617.96]EXJ88279.1 hypothetical protein A1O1_05209 [Capronia coronata CBS 617.96]